MAQLRNLTSTNRDMKTLHDECYRLPLYYDTTTPSLLRIQSNLSYFRYLDHRRERQPSFTPTKMKLTDVHSKSYHIVHLLCISSTRPKIGYDLRHLANTYYMKSEYTFQDVKPWKEGAIY